MKTLISKILFILITILYCNTREIQIIINNANSDELRVMQLVQNDTLQLDKSRENFYRIKKNLPQISLLVYIKKHTYKINIDKYAKSIVIEYNKDSSENCYIIHKIYSDAISSSNMQKINYCDAITQIYIYNKLKPKNQTFKIRKRQ